MELTKEDIHNLIVFMDRTNLTGGEVATFVSLYQKLQKLKEGAENADRDISGQDFISYNQDKS